MAATGKTPILIYGSTTATNVPIAGNLTNSSDGCEIAINVADKNLFFKDSTNTVNTVPIRQSSGSSDGWLSSANWTTFNSKQAAYTNLTSIGSLANATGWLYNNGSGTFSYSTPSASDVGAVPTTRTISTTAPLSGGGDLSANRTLTITQATTSTNGYLSSTDWNTFNGKANAYTYTTGQIVFGQGTNTPAQDSNLYWDNTNKRLAIGTNSFGFGTKLQVVGGRSYFASNSDVYATSIAYNGTRSLAGQVVYLGATDATNPDLIVSNGDATQLLKIGGTTYNVTAVNGNFVVGTSGKGIDFSATAGTGTSELLADYEEGTWTPVLKFGGNAVGMTGTFTGNYTKFGRAVLVYGRILLTAKGSSTGNMSITGLPYTSIDNSSGIADPSAGMAGLTAGGAIPMGISSTTVYMFLQTTTSRNLLTDANFTNTSDIRFSLVYNT